MTNAELREKELAVVEHMKHGWHDGCQCEPCIAVREIVKEAQAQATPQGQRSDGQILLWKFGFQSVLCGFDGKSFYYCKECQFYEEGHNHKTGLTKETVRHKPDCMLEGALRVSASAQAQGDSQAIKEEDVEFNLEQAKMLLAMFGGEEASITVKKWKGGLCAYHTEYPEEGSVVLERGSCASRLPSATAQPEPPAQDSK